MHPGILILDFGSQYTQLLARRVRELQVYSEIRPCTEKCDLTQSWIQGIILSGGPASVTGPDAPPFDRKWLELGVPVLGVCYGMQLMAQLLGGEVGKGERREYGFATLDKSAESELTKNFFTIDKASVWMSHGDHVKLMPKGFELLASTDSCQVAAFGNKQTKMYGVQFHPEVVHTMRGSEVIKNFVCDISRCLQTWKPVTFVETAVTAIQKQAGDSGDVICALSGGVDSTVAAALVFRAVGKRLKAIFVDNGLVRQGEIDEVKKLIGPEGLGLDLLVVDARERFLSALQGVADPEQKRKIIGREFIEVFDAETKSLKDVKYLVQGTLYPDVIESVSVRGPAATIKSHHNVGGLPERMKLKLIEPLRELFKDEVRSIGRTLGVPESILKRQPFPGPGLAVRVLGALTPERIGMVRAADAIVQAEVRAAGWYDKVWQSFAVLLPVKSVGVMGDGRTYEETICIRAVHSDDGMTAEWAALPPDLIRRISTRITNEVRGINRVVLDVSNKPPSTIEWE